MDLAAAGIVREFPHTCDRALGPATRNMPQGTCHREHARNSVLRRAFPCTERREQRNSEDGQPCPSSAVLVRDLANGAFSMKAHHHHHHHYYNYCSSYLQQLSMYKMHAQPHETNAKIHIKKREKPRTALQAHRACKSDGYLEQPCVQPSEVGMSLAGGAEGRGRMLTL